MLAENLRKQCNHRNKLSRFWTILGPPPGQNHFWLNLICFGPFWGLPRAQAIFGQIWSVLGHFGASPGPQQFFAKFGTFGWDHFGASPGPRPFFVKFGPFWAILDAFLGLFFVKFGPFWTILGRLPGPGHFCLNLVRFESFWGVPRAQAIFGQIWSVLDHFGPFPGAKPFLVKFGPFWIILGRPSGPGHFWLNLVRFGPFWGLPRAQGVKNG